MKKLMNLLRGMVSVRVEGAFPERLLNLCAQNRVDFWGVEWEDPCTFTCVVRRSGLKRMLRLGERIGCTIAVGSGTGLPYFLERFRKRYAFWVGLCLSMVAVCFVSGFVFTVEVTGNQSVPSAQILGELRRLGLRPGAYGPALELKQMSQEALLSLEKLSWMTINLHGTRAEVIVREAVPPPEIVDETGCYHVVSRADGIVTEVDALAGEAMVKEGDTVAKGDVLISGEVTMEPPMYSDAPTLRYQTHARGAVWARTWRTLQGKIPLTANVKAYTGEEKKLHTLVIFGHPIEFYQNSSISWTFYDKINNVYPVVLPGNVRLPAAWRVQHIQAYEPQPVQINREAAQTLLEQRLEEQLEWLIGEDGQIQSVQYSAVVRGDWLTVTLRAQCMEEIGREILAGTGEQGQDVP